MPPEPDTAPGRWRAGRPLHLVRRFGATLVPIGPRRGDRDWIAEVLGEDELVLFRRMRPADRRHAATVARRVEVALGHEADGPVLAAALLHDVGKVEARLGAYGRVAATLSGMAVGGDPDVIRAWTRTRGLTRRIGLYLQHPRLGGDLLALAGADPLTVAWAREHHLPPDRWTVPAHLGEVLKAADDD
jgi:hypothetical protein